MISRRNFLKGIIGSIGIGLLPKISLAQEKLNKDDSIFGKFYDKSIYFYGKKKYINAEIEYFNKFILPILRKAEIDKKTIDYIYENIYKLKIIVMNKNYSYYDKETRHYGLLPIGGQALYEKENLYQEKIEILIPELITEGKNEKWEYNNKSIKFSFTTYKKKYYDKEEPGSIKYLNPDYIDLGKPILILNGFFDFITISGTLIHELEHIKQNIEKLNLNLIEQEYLAHKKQAEFYIKIGAKDNLEDYHIAALDGIIKFFETADPIYHWKKNGINLNQQIIEKYYN